MDDKKVILAARPSAGIWYYVFDKNWGLNAWRANEAPYTGHPEVWKYIIVPKMAQKLGFSPSVAEKIGELPYCMPRGRVDATLADGENYKWVLYHGNDFPSGVSVEAERRKLVSYFNLTGPFIRGEVSFQEVPHEKMMDDQKEAFRVLTGINVPY
jgi:hypothetical protein